MVAFACLGMAFATYLLVGITPLAPKRLVLPLALFTPIALLALIPIYFWYKEGWAQISIGISVAQLFLVLVVCWLNRAWFARRWPIIGEEKLRGRTFSWSNLLGFIAANILIGIPAFGVYLAVCASMGVRHSSEGFLSLDLGGLSVESRTYANAENKKVQLVPMAHVGDKSFYTTLSKSFPTNALILMEGVTDDEELMPDKMSYKKMASTLGLTEQHENFEPEQARQMGADVDISDFSPSTIELLKTVALLHTKGITAETVGALFEKTQSPEEQEKFWDDILRKRNDHLLEVIESELPNEDFIVVPWGALHMPGISKQLQTNGFKLVKTKKYRVISF